jgi:hypothetical protein
VDESSRDLPGPTVGAVERQGDVVERARRQRAEPDRIRLDLIRPRADARDRIGRACGRPCPVLERSLARVFVDIRLAPGMAYVVPVAVEQVGEQVAVQVAAVSRKLLAAAEDAEEGQDQRHRRGPLEVRSRADLRG